MTPQSALFVVTVFAGVYAGMALGRWPGLRIDRTGIALLGAILLHIGEAVSAEGVLLAIDFPTLIVLFGLMILSAQFAACGFYDWCSVRIAASRAPPAIILALTVVVAGGLSAVLANDVIVFAMTPLLCAGLKSRGLDPRPYLIALAGAANAGSAATSSATRKTSSSARSAGCGSGSSSWPAARQPCWGAADRLRDRPRRVAQGAAPRPAATSGCGHAAARPAAAGQVSVCHRCAVSALHVAATATGGRVDRRRLPAGQPQDGDEEPARTGRLAPARAVRGLIRRPRALTETGLPGEAIVALTQAGLAPDRLSVLTPLALIGSNTIGNVPAVILLLTVLPTLPESTLYALALLTTLAGNLLIVGSLANIIMVERAKDAGVALTFAQHARSGVPMTLASCATAVTWLLWRGQGSSW